MADVNSEIESALESITEARMQHAEWRYDTGTMPAAYDAGRVREATDGAPYLYIIVWEYLA
jgi:hypothetical protein